MYYWKGSTQQAEEFLDQVWWRFYSKYWKSKRRAANSEKDIVQAIIGELNFPKYKKAYIALVDYFDLAVPGNYSSSSQFSTESEWKPFLKSFVEALYQKLHWER